MKMDKRERIAERIEDFIVKNFHIDSGHERFGRTCNLFDEGFVDSMGLIRLITFLEGEFHIKIEEDHFFDERLLSIDGESLLIVELMEK